MMEDINRKQVKRLDRYVQGEMKRLGLTTEDLAKYKLEIDTTEPKWSSDGNSVSVTITYRMVKR